jgi:hypothetical protein
MKRTALIAASALAASFALVPFAQAGQSQSYEGFFLIVDDDVASVPEPATESSTPANRDKELAELREQIYRDMRHE